MKDADEEGAVNTGSNLFVTGIHPRLSEQDVTRLFDKYGEVESCSIMLDPHTKESRGFGFVKMMTSEQADAAKEGLQGEVIEGRTLSIEKARRARPRTPTPGKYFGPPKRGESLPLFSAGADNFQATLVHLDAVAAASVIVIMIDEVATEVVVMTIAVAPAMETTTDVDTAAEDVIEMTAMLLPPVISTDMRADAMTATEVVVIDVEVEATTTVTKTVPTMLLRVTKLLLANPTAVAETMDEMTAIAAADRCLLHHEHMKQLASERTLAYQVLSFISKLLSIPQMYFQIVNFS
jgi:RNA recognition motif. (a.k.a. RRM, RBD, or RNP domain)